VRKAFEAAYSASFSRCCRGCACIVSLRVRAIGRRPLRFSVFAPELPVRSTGEGRIAKVGSTAGARNRGLLSRLALPAGAGSRPGDPGAADATTVIEPGHSAASTSSASDRGAA
jgi:hypothetical protein